MLHAITASASRSAP